MVNELVWKKEWEKLLKQELKYQEGVLEKKENGVTKAVQEKIPEKAQKSMNTAFEKAFSLIFYHGVSVIEKTYDRQEMEEDFKINEFAAQVREHKKAAKVFQKNAKISSNKNIALSGVKGVGFGLLGVGLADVPVFVSMVLKGVYEVALHYGFGYEGEEEEFFLLEVLIGGLSSDELWLETNQSLNTFIENGEISPKYQKDVTISLVSTQLSSEVLCMKFIQGIPLVGVIGGLADVVFMKKILRYANLKYNRRFLYKKVENGLKIEERRAELEKQWEELED